jgi:uncharacterized protein
MDILKYFPEGIAKGDAFINRAEERHYLINRIKANKHTILMAPRRYGKTSLVIKIAEEMRIPYCTIDLLAAFSEEYVRDQIVDKISRLVFDILPSVNKAKEKVINIFKKLKPEISIGVFGQKLTFNLSSSPLKDITELLLKLDETAQYFKRGAVVFIDEFQQISKLKNYHSIEAAIRHAMERSDKIAYVFSGSNRSLLEQMFGDQGRPLYRLCQTVQLERIKKADYMDHLQKLAKTRWKASMAINAIEHIFDNTELHPFYMNILCQNVWRENQMPSANTIDSIWHNYVKTQRNIISHDIMELSSNQRKILIALSKCSVKKIQSTEFTAPLKISASSTQQAIEILASKDLIYQTNDGFYRILDPAMKYYLNVILWDDREI